MTIQRLLKHQRVMLSVIFITWTPFLFWPYWQTTQKLLTQCSIVTIHILDHLKVNQTIRVRQTPAEAFSLLLSIFIAVLSFSVHKNFRFLSSFSFSTSTYSSVASTITVELWMRIHSQICTKSVKTNASTHQFSSHSFRQTLWEFACFLLSIRSLCVSITDENQHKTTILRNSFNIVPIFGA